MKKTLYLVFALMALLLTGCGTREVIKEVPVYKTQYIVVAPTDIQLKTIASSPPPNKQLYLSLSDDTQANWLKKEDLLKTSYIMQTDSLRQCNATLQEVKSWRDKQVQLYTDKNKDKSP
jgi:hypothetical protein